MKTCEVDGKKYVKVVAIDDTYICRGCVGNGLTEESVKLCTNLDDCSDNSVYYIWKECSN